MLTIRRSFTPYTVYRRAVLGVIPKRLNLMRRPERSGAGGVPRKALIREPDMPHGRAST
jgi:hypothetical protein